MVYQWIVLQEWVRKQTNAEMGQNWERIILQTRPDGLPRPSLTPCSMTSSVWVETLQGGCIKKKKLAVTFVVLKGDEENSVSSCNYQRRNIKQTLVFTPELQLFKLNLSVVEGRLNISQQIYCICRQVDCKTTWSTGSFSSRVLE